MLSNTGSKRSAKKRRILNTQNKEILRRWFYDHFDNPYPTGNCVTNWYAIIVNFPSFPHYFKRAGKSIFAEFNTHTEGPT